MIDFEYQQYNMKQGLTNYGRQYHVDWEHGDDGNDGRDWAHAFATIEAARNAQNALINWGVNDPIKYDIIWIRPGQYIPVGDATYGWPSTLMAPYFCHMIGLGIVGDGGQGVDIIPAAGSALAGMMSGTHIANIAFKVADASDIMDFNLGGSHMTRSLIEHCKFEGGAAVTPCGIDCESGDMLEVRNCWFYSFQGLGLAITDAIVFRAPGWCNGVHIHHNHIFAIDNGILVEAGVVGSQSIFADNFIAGSPWSPAAPRVAVGIADLQGVSYCLRNYIVATDCINHAGGNEYLIANREIQAGGAAIEFAGTN